MLFLSESVLPSLRDGRRALQRHEVAILYFLACSVPVAVAGVSHSAPLDRWEAFGAALGITALAAMALQILSAGRFKRISGGIGVDRIMAFHKIIALWVLLAALTHPLVYVIPTFLDEPSRGLERLVAYLTMPQFHSGMLALVATLLLIATGISRNLLPYEVWRGIHIGLIFLALGSAVHHALSVGRLSALGPMNMLIQAIAATALTAFAVLYGWRWLMLHRRRWRLARVNKLADRIWELQITPESAESYLSYQAGQFVWVSEGKRRFPLFDHPFSLAGRPSDGDLRLIIREVGDFTRRLVRLPPGTLIGIDGPYGTFTLDHHSGDTVLLVAGGVGISPIMGILRDLLARGDKRPILLAYAAGSPDSFACLSELDAAKKRLDLHVMLISEENATGWQGENGVLDREKLSRLLDGHTASDTVALICGPGVMVTSVADTLLDIGLPMAKVMYERFDYAGGLAARQDRRRTAGIIGLLLGVTLMAAALSQIVLFPGP